MNTMNAKVDTYFKKAQKWQEELKLLRKILLGSGLTEKFKWAKPCYTFQDRNAVVVLPLKNYCTLLFCKGALLKDPKGILIKAGENTQATRQVRFTSLQEIVGKETILKAYIKQAIANEKAGLEVVYKKITDFAVPEELQNKLDELPALKTAFAALTPGRQRGYLIFFSSAKQPKTRYSRIAKSMPKILQGKGYNER